MSESNEWDSLEDIITTNGRLKAENEKLKRDKLRLDWLFIDQEPYIIYDRGHCNQYIEDRKAIDAVMEEPQP